MKVSPVVSVLRGEDAVLSCSFTHPYQQDYSGTITVKWLARESRAQPFFTCSIKNDSADGLGDCAASTFRYSLKGDPRRGELSLLIRTVHLNDNVKPQILSLSVVEGSPGSDGAPRRLQCEVEGHPLPSITWLSASGRPIREQVQTSGAGPYRLLSSVPYLEGDVFTCRAESWLGAAETTYPPNKTLTIALTVSGLVVLLLSTGLICCGRHRAAAQVDTSHVYGNAEEVEKQQLRCRDSPAEGAAELQLVYSTLTVNNQHASFKSSTGRQEDTGELTVKLLCVAVVVVVCCFVVVVKLLCVVVVVVKLLCCCYRYCCVFICCCLLLLLLCVVVVLLCVVVVVVKLLCVVVVVLLCVVVVVVKLLCVVVVLVVVVVVAVVVVVSVVVVASAVCRVVIVVVLQREALNNLKPLCGLVSVAAACGDAEAFSINAAEFKCENFVGSSEIKSSTLSTIQIIINFQMIFNSLVCY
ncbi:hypothetical protein L3Q82_002257 [Scortum barcoo]|uniref:Uncharacterized protein n=1 Tax=Scortum barcoo TaxID=214431 RepID=A0ACB8VYZ8_9TELE|nr:hypothetical protein L3Q82_002257 [Scortum barcoo]